MLNVSYKAFATHHYIMLNWNCIRDIIVEY